MVGGIWNGCNCAWLVSKVGSEVGGDVGAEGGVEVGVVIGKKVGVGIGAVRAAEVGVGVGSEVVHAIATTDTRIRKIAFIDIVLRYFPSLM